MSKELKTDYLIAGAGIAGILLASKLAASGKKIILLDQGPRITEVKRSELLQQSKDTLNDFTDYNDDVDEAVLTPCSSSTTSPNEAQWAPLRLFGLGGTALHFEGLMLRPREDDLKVRSLYGFGRDWPIDYTELEPWLLHAEQEVGVAGNDDNPYASARSGPFPMPAHEFSYFDREIFGPALKTLGMTGHSCPRATNSQPYGGRSACLACRICKFCPSGARYSPDRRHLLALDESPNVFVLDSTTLRRLETTPDGSTITAAHTMLVRDKTPIVIRARKYVVALGGVETPRLLLLSAANGAHKNGLGNTGGQLGRGFSDHFNPWITIDTGRPTGSRLGFETMICDHFRAQVDRREKPTFFMLASPAMDWFPIGVEAAAWSTTNDVLNLDELRSRIPNIATLATMTELEGKGTLELDPDKLDAFGSPVAKVTMPLSDRDRLGATQLTELAPKLADAMGASRVSDVPPPELTMGYHPSGATAMAKTPDEGVCDDNLKVFGLDNLYLASNSVFPHMAANPPTLTIAALALRLADHLEGGNGR